MRRTLVAALCLVFAGSLSAAPKKSTLDAPAAISCSGDCNNASVTWSPVDGANSYAVEFIAGYDTSGDSVVDVTNNFSFTVAPVGGNVGDQTFSTAFADFEQDFGAGPVAPLTLSVHVKALNPPTRKGGAQSNPFSAFCDVVANTTCVTQYCHDITKMSGSCLASQVCLDHPIDATSSDDAKAACEACFGAGQCSLIGGAASAWRNCSGPCTYYFFSSGGALGAGEIWGPTINDLLGRWAP